MSIEHGQLDLAMLRKARRILDAAPIPDGVIEQTARVLAEFDKINDAIDMHIIAELHWGARFTDPRNNPFR